LQTFFQPILRHFPLTVSRKAQGARGKQLKTLGENLSGLILNLQEMQLLA
jgi:hypothetical protein